MEFEYMTKFVVNAAFGAVIGWYIWFIGCSIYFLVKWIKKKVRERKEKKAE